MSILTITLKVLPEKREEFLQSVHMLHKEIKNEKGFNSSSLFQDVDDDNRFNIVEEWETQDDLDNHLQSKLHKVLLGAVKVLCEQHEIHSNFLPHQSGRQVLKT